MPNHQHIRTDLYEHLAACICVPHGNDPRVRVTSDDQALEVALYNLETCPDNTCGQRLVELGEQIKAERLAIARDRQENETVFTEEAKGDA